jgi:hypothetical protein
MALFRIEVDSFLQLGKFERDALKAIVEAQEAQASSMERIAVALEAIALKLTEPDEPQATTLEIQAGTPTPQQGA